MNKLTAFLNPETTEQTQEVIISQRFKGEDGKPVPFTIRTISQDESDRLMKACTRKWREKGQVFEDFDKLSYSRKLIMACTVFPDFSSSELCKRYGTEDPEEVPGKMLLFGEYMKLTCAINDLNGLGEDPLDEAKNS